MVYTEMHGFEMYMSNKIDDLNSKQINLYVYEYFVY